MVAPKVIRKAFLDHPDSVNESYVEHFGVSFGVARQLAAASAKAMIHAFVPGLCCTSASAKIKELNAFVTSGARADAAAEQSAAQATA